MKQSILIFTFLLLLTEVNAQKTASGYWVSQKDDTITAQIRIKKGAFGQVMNDFLKEVEIIDSVKGNKKFTPNDIKSYGFTHEGRRYLFVSKPTKDSVRKFLVPVYLGSKSSLYQYGTFTSGALPDQKTFYTFEKADGSYLFLRDILNNKFRASVKDFYKDSDEVQKIIDTRLRYWLELRTDLVEILQAANK